jgi:hypothetical protein
MNSNLSNSTELKPDISRQAAAIFRGYAYQAYQTVFAWLNLIENEELYAEFAEDIDLVKRDAEGLVTEAELNQIKYEQQNITLKSVSVTNLLNNFLKHKSRNPSIKIQIRLCTIADRGKEKNINWIFAETGLDLWDSLKGRLLTAHDQKKAICILRSFLIENKKLSQDLKNFIAQSDDQTFLNELIDRVSWDTGQQAYGQIEDSIKKVFAKRPRPITDSVEVRQILDRLWRNVADTIATDPDRNFSKEKLESILSEETSVAIDRCIIKDLLLNNKEIKQSVAKMEGSIENFLQKSYGAKPLEGQPFEVNVPAFIERSDRLPPLPKICSDRGKIINTIQTKCKDKCLIWLSGSTGYGKTTLANLYVRNLEKAFLWFRLREYQDYTLMSAIEIIKQIIFRSNVEHIIVVMDDIMIKYNNTFITEQLAEIVEFLKSNKSQLIITSQVGPSSNLKSILGKEICLFDVPEMSKEEIELILLGFGLTNENIKFWSGYIFGMTSGHPQLVNAYVTYGKDINWKLSKEDFFQKPRSVEEVKAESRKLLMEIIKSDEARELARRLSLVAGFFSRQFAIDVGIADPSLKEPGQAFDMLVGPWIEAEGEGFYTLSPLLSGYAEAEFGQDNLLSYYKMIATTFLKQKSINAMQVSQIFTTSLMAKEELPILKICNTLRSMSDDKFEIVAKEISLIRFIYVDTPAKLDWMSPHVKIIFRMMQLKVAMVNEDLDQFLKIDGNTLNEILEYQTMPFYNELLLFYYIYACIIFPSPISVATRCQRALFVIDMVTHKLVEEQLISTLASIGTISTIFWFITTDIKTIDDLDYLINLVEKQPREIILELNNGFNFEPETFSLLIDRVWLSESRKETPRWEICEKLFSKIMYLSKRIENAWLLAAAARGKMVVLDEYLNKPDEALQVADEARIILNYSHPLIDLGESMICYRHDKFTNALEIIDKLEKSLPPQILSISRLHSTRRGIICAANLKMWDKVIDLAQEGEKIAEYVKLEWLDHLSRIAFRTEVAWAYHEKGEIAFAAEELEQILKEIEAFENQQYPLFHIFLLRFGHALGWLGEFMRHEDLSMHEEKNGKFTRPFSGMFSNLEDPPEESLQRQAASYNPLWAFIACYSALTGPSDLVRRCAARAMTEIDHGQYKIAVIKAWEALFVREILEENFEQALYSGLQYSRFLSLGSLLQADMGQEKIAFEPIDLEKKFNELRPESFNRWIESIPFGVFEPILMALLISNKSLSTRFSEFKDIFEKEVGKIEKFNLTIDFIETIVMASSGDQKCINKIVIQNKTKIPDYLERYLFIANCVSTSLPLADVLSYQGSMLLNIASKPRYEIWCILFCQLVAKRWLYLAQEQAFLLTAPRYSVNQIIDSASVKIPNLSDCAKLLLLVSSSVGLTFSADMFSAIKSLIKEH